MGLTESKGNMYSWAKPWNPLGGQCMHDCSYCSTKSLKRYPVIADKYSGQIRLYSDLFKLPKKTKTIFVVAQNDLFANDVPTQYIIRVLQECKKNPQHTYFFQTKNPERYNSFGHDFPEKSIFCTTIESNRTYKQMGSTPYPIDRALEMNDFVQDNCNPNWSFEVTIEPIMDFDLEEMVYIIETCLPDKINIGADSKGHHLPEPSKDKILALIEELKKFTIIDQKRNLARLLR
jgi:hypothetical protein